MGNPFGDICTSLRKPKRNNQTPELFDEEPDPDEEDVKRIMTDLKEKVHSALKTGLGETGSSCLFLHPHWTSEGSHRSLR